MIQMKSRNILIASFAALFLASSCSDVMESDEIVKANPGDEVVFGAALPATKTVYGEEDTDNNRDYIGNINF